MAEDWAIDVRKYAPEADSAAIAGIVRHCGIALRNRDSSLVSFTDSAETDRVRENYCRKKLALTDDNATLDAAIASVGQRMSGDATRNRVTVYYLLAEHFGKLGMFGGAAAAAAAPAPAMAAATLAATLVAPAAAFAAMPSAAAAHPAARNNMRSGDGTFALAGCGLLAVLIIGAGAVGTMIGTRPARVPAAIVDAAPVASMPVAAAPVSVAAAPAPAAAIPQGSGVTAEVMDGKPKVSVYFDTAKTDVSPDFATVAAPVKAWIDGHPGARAAVSGFNDTSGNAAFNAELSKNRAKAVKAALAALGVAEDSIDLEKPPETTDTGTTPEQARRVDIVVKDAS